MELYPATSLKGNSIALWEVVTAEHVYDGILENLNNGTTLNGLEVNAEIKTQDGPAVSTQQVYH